MDGDSEDLVCQVKQTGPASLQPWVLPAVLVLFTVGFWTASSYIANVPAAEEFEDVAEFDVHVVLIGGWWGAMRWRHVCTS